MEGRDVRADERGEKGEREGMKREKRMGMLGKGSEERR